MAHDDFFERLSRQMEEPEPQHDAATDYSKAIDALEESANKVLAALLLGGLLDYVRHGRTDFLMGFLDTWAVQKDEKTLLILDDRISHLVALAFKHIEDLQQVEDVELREKVERQPDPRLLEGQMYITMRERFNPTSRTARGVIASDPTGSEWVSELSLISAIDTL